MVSKPIRDGDPPPATEGPTRRQAMVSGAVEGTGGISAATWRPSRSQPGAGWTSLLGRGNSMCKGSEAAVS